MLKKERLRKKFFSLRKKRYFEIKQSFFNPLVKLIKKKYKKKSVVVSSYYPSCYEVNVLKFFDVVTNLKINLLLPVISKNKKEMFFFKWSKNQILQINKFGMLEPLFIREHIIPEIMLIPLVAYDKQKNRLGYGGGFYDRYLNRYLRLHKNILTIGIAFSFQKHHKLPFEKNDVKLNYIMNEKGIF